MSQLDKTMKEENPTIRAATFKVLEQYLQAGNNNASNMTDATADDSECTSSLPIHNDYLIPYARYKLCLNTYIVSMGFQDSSWVVKALCCDCLSHLPHDFFKTLSAAERIGIVTVVLGMMSSASTEQGFLDSGGALNIKGDGAGIDVAGDVNVRIAACRTAGVFVSFPTLQEVSFSLVTLLTCVQIQKSTKVNPC